MSLDYRVGRGERPQQVIEIEGMIKAQREVNISSCL
jgi:hypothetical protein